MSRPPERTPGDGRPAVLQRVLWLLAGATFVLRVRSARARALQAEDAPALSDAQAGSRSSVFATATGPLADGHPSDSAQEPMWADARARVAFDCLLIALVPATIAVSLLQAHGTARVLLALAAACLLPGGALLTRLSSDDPLSAFALAVALSLCVETIGALFMIWTGWWHPLGFSALIAGLSCLLLALDIRRSLSGLPGRLA
jgi:hypothetical protein